MCPPALFLCSERAMLGNRRQGDARNRTGKAMLLLTVLHFLVVLFCFVLLAFVNLTQTSIAPTPGEDRVTVENIPPSD